MLKFHYDDTQKIRELPGAPLSTIRHVRTTDLRFATGNKANINLGH